MNDAECIEATAEMLESLEGKKVWMTARALWRRLGRDAGVSQPRLYQLLIEQSERGRDHRRIRQSAQPSLKTLETIWGAVEKVGEADVKSPILKAEEEQSGEPDWREVGDEERDAGGAADVFLSYSHNDAAWAAEVAEALERKDLVVWISGHRIAQGEYINEAIRSAMKACRELVVYLTKTSFESPWVAKEAIVSEAWNLPRSVVIHGGHEKLVRQVKAWMKADGDDRELVERLIDIPTIGSTFFDLLKEHVTGGGPVYLHPAVERETALPPLAEFRPRVP